MTDERDPWVPALREALEAAAREDAEWEARTVRGKDQDAEFAKLRAEYEARTA